MDELLNQPPAGATGAEEISRRQFLTGAAAGGAVGIAVAAGTGLAVWKIADEQAQVALGTAEAEIARLQGLLDLYEGLEKIGLDAILATGMAAVALPLRAVEQGAVALMRGLQRAEEVFRTVEDTIPSAQESILWLEMRVSKVADAIERLESSVAEALDRAAGNQVVAAVQDFAAMVLDSLPFRLGERIRDVLDELVSLVTSVDDLVQGINGKLLEPLRERWFSSDEGKGIAAMIVDPLVENVLDPLQDHLKELAMLASAWQSDMLAPTSEALERRERVRAEIARYREEHGFG